MSGKKTLFILLLACYLLTSVIIPTKAIDYYDYEAGVFEIKDKQTETDKDNIESLIYNSETREYYQKNKPGYMERAVASLIISVIKWIMNTFHVADPVVLIFGKNLGTEDEQATLSGFLGSGNKDDLILGIFPEPFFKGISVLYTIFEKLLPFSLAIAVILLAVLLMMGAGTIQGRTRVKDNVAAIFIALILLRFGHYIWSWLIEINNFLIDLIWAYMLDSGVKPGALMDIIWGGKTGFEGAASMNTISIAILLFLAGMMILALNFQYVMRAIILGLLIAIFPLVAALSVFPSFRGSLESWFQEFFANTIIQLAHAVALGGFFIILYTPGIGKGGIFWLMLVYFMGLPAIAGLVRSMLGLKAGFGGIMGGVAGIGGMLGGIGGKSGKAGGPKDKMPGPVLDEKGQTSSGGGFKPKTGAQTTVGKVLQGAYNMAGRVMSSNAARTAARMGVGATAAVAGGVLSGMLTGDFASGARAGKNLSQSAMNGLGWVGGKVSTILDKMKGPSTNLPEYRENKKIMDMAQENMNKTKPQLDLAYAQWKHAEAYHSKGSPEINEAYKKYDEIRTQYKKNQADELLARTRLTTMGYIKEKAAPLNSSNASYSERRGRV
jgi:hypothetical protein